MQTETPPVKATPILKKSPLVKSAPLVRCQRLFDEEDEVKLQMYRNRPDRKLIERDIPIRRPCLTVFTHSKSLDSSEYSKVIGKESMSLSNGSSQSTNNLNDLKKKPVRVQSLTSFTSSFSELDGLNDLIGEDKTKNDFQLKRNTPNSQILKTSKIVSVNSLSDGFTIEKKNENDSKDDCDENV